MQDLRSRILATSGAILMLIASAVNLHAAPPDPATEDPALATYLLTGGSLDDLCTPGDASAGGGPHCELCRQTDDDPAQTVPRSGIWSTTLRSVPMLWHLVAQQRIRHTFLDNSPRAPPPA